MHVYRRKIGDLDTTPTGDPAKLEVDLFDLTAFLGDASARVGLG